MAVYGDCNMKEVVIGNTHIGMGGNPSDKEVESIVNAVLNKYNGGGNGGGGTITNLDVVLYKGEICARVPEGQGVFKLVPLQKKWEIKMPDRCVVCGRYTKEHLGDCVGCDVYENIGKENKNGNDKSASSSTLYGQDAQQIRTESADAEST